MNPMDKFVTLCLTIAFLVIVVAYGFFPKRTGVYRLGVEDTHKEAFENGLMVKEIDKNDKVVYRWIELHKVQNEDN